MCRPSGVVSVSMWPSGWDNALQGKLAHELPGVEVERLDLSMVSDVGVALLPMPARSTRCDRA